MSTPNFSFHSADFVGREGQRVQLQGAEADISGPSRKPVRLRLIGKRGTLQGILEMSRKEAYAFSEWLDVAVTQTLAIKNIRKDRENES